MSPQQHWVVGREYTVTGAAGKEKRVVFIQRLDRYLVFRPVRRPTFPRKKT